MQCIRPAVCIRNKILCIRPAVCIQSSVMHTAGRMHRHTDVMHTATVRSLQKVQGHRTAQGRSRRGPRGRDSTHRRPCGTVTGRFAPLTFRPLDVSPLHWTFRPLDVSPPTVDVSPHLLFYVFVVF